MGKCAALCVGAINKLGTRLTVERCLTSRGKSFGMAKVLCLW
jgi:hypothetical protein